VEQGLAAQTVEHILEPDCPGLDKVDRLVRDYAVQVTEKPNGMGDAIFADLRRHFSEEQIVELTVRTALCGFFNRVNDAMQIGIEDGVVEDMRGFFNRVNDAMQIGIEDGVVEDMLAHGLSEETLPEAVK
jgi:hypothetical protein